MSSELAPSGSIADINMRTPGLMAADTLYDTTLYSPTSIDHPPEYLSRIEYDRLNTIKVPDGLLSAEPTIITGPTRYPLLHNYNIVCKTDADARALYTNISSQFNRQMSPLYLMYRSTDNTPRVVTKDQIPTLIDENHVLEPHFQPTPLVSLNYPTVVNSIQNPTTSPFTNVLSSSALGTALYMTSAYKPQSSRVVGTVTSLNNNSLSFQNQPPAYFQQFATPQLYRNIAGSTLLHGIGLWNGYFALREYFLGKVDYHRPTTITGAGYSQGYAMDGYIWSDESQYKYQLPFALSLKLPDIFPSPVDRTIASAKAGLIVAPLYYVLGHNAMQRKLYETVYHTTGFVPPNMANIASSLNTNTLAKHQGAIPLPTSLHSAIEPLTDLNTKKFPLYGLLNKRFYEAFYYDHISPHLYTIYHANNGYLPPPQSMPSAQVDSLLVLQSQNRGLSASSVYNADAELMRTKITKKLLTHVDHGNALKEQLKQFNPSPLRSLLNLFLPFSPKQAEQYNAIVNHRVADAFNDPADSSKSTKINYNILNKPPFVLDTIAKRYKHHGLGLVAALGLWAHLHTTIFAYESVRQLEINTTGRPSYLSFFSKDREGASKANNSNIDVVFKHEIMHTPNMAVQHFMDHYYRFKLRNKTLWDEHLSTVDNNEMTSTQSRLNAIRQLSVDGMTLGARNFDLVQRYYSRAKDRCVMHQLPLVVLNAQKNNLADENLLDPESVQPLGTEDELAHIPAPVDSTLQMKKQDILNKNRMTLNNTPFHKRFSDTYYKDLHEYHEQSTNTTPSIAARIGLAVGIGLFASIASSYVLHPVINCQARAKIKQLTGKTPSKFQGTLFYTLRSLLMHSLVLGKIAYDDVSSYNSSVDVVNNVIQTNLSTPHKLRENPLQSVLFAESSKEYLANGLLSSLHAKHGNESADSLTFKSVTKNIDSFTELGLFNSFQQQREEKLNDDLSTQSSKITDMKNYISTIGYDLYSTTNLILPSKNKQYYQEYSDMIAKNNSFTRTKDIYMKEVKQAYIDGDNTPIIDQTVDQIQQKFDNVVMTSLQSAMSTPHEPIDVFQENFADLFDPTKQSSKNLIVNNRVKNNTNDPHAISTLLIENLDAFKRTLKYKSAIFGQRVVPASTEQNSVDQSLLHQITELSTGKSDYSNLDNLKLNTIIDPPNNIDLGKRTSLWSMIISMFDSDYTLDNTPYNTPTIIDQHPNATLLNVTPESLIIKDKDTIIEQFKSLLPYRLKNLSDYKINSQKSLETIAKFITPKEDALPGDVTTFSRAVDYFIIESQNLQKANTNIVGLKALLESFGYWKNVLPFITHDEQGNLVITDEIARQAYPDATTELLHSLYDTFTPSLSKTLTNMQKEIIDSYLIYLVSIADNKANGVTMPQEKLIFPLIKPEEEFIEQYIQSKASYQKYEQYQPILKRGLYFLPHNFKNQRCDVCRSQLHKREDSFTACHCDSFSI